MKEILEYLAKAESIEVHRISTESDITAPYGIARAKHPNADIFDTIDGIAESVGITDASKNWSENDIDKINAKIKRTVSYQTYIYSEAEDFYKEFLKGAHLELFPPECKVAMYSIYTNSPKGAWMSVQQSIRDLFSNRYVKANPIADGACGKNTKSALNITTETLHNQRFSGHYFETLMLSNMKTYYAKLAVANPDKYLVSLKGWNNRMNELAKMR